MLRNGCYAKVWKINMDRQNPSLQITVSRKNKQTNEYKQTFGGFVDCLFDAKEKASQLTEGCTIKVLEMGIENSYNKETKVTNTFVKLMDFELDGGSSAPVVADEEDDEDVPF